MSAKAAQPTRRPRRRWPKKPYRPNQGIVSTQASPELRARTRFLAAATGTNVSRLLHDALTQRLDEIEQALDEASLQGAEVNDERKGDGVI